VGTATSFVEGTDARRADLPVAREFDRRGTDSVGSSKWIIVVAV
jgi:hypothetical protein